MAFNPLKLLPFFIIHKFSMRWKNTPQGILKFFTGWEDTPGYKEKPKYVEHIVSIRELFYGQFMFTTENYELEQRKACLKKELEKVEDKLSKR